MRSRLFDLRARNHSIVTRLRAIADGAKGRKMTGAEATEFARLEQESDAILPEIRREERSMEEQGYYTGGLPAAPASSAEQLAQRALSGNGRGTVRAALAELFGGAPAMPEAEAGRRHAGLLRATIAGNFASEFFATGQSEGESSTGGFGVAPEFSRRWWNGAALVSKALQLFHVEPMRSREKQIALLDDFDRSSDAVAEVEADWTAEGGALSLQTARLRQLTLQAHKTGMLLEVSRELLDDGEGVADGFSRAMASAIALKIDKVVFNSGTGGGSPLSVLNGDAFVAVDPEGGQSGGTLTYGNLTAMVSRLPEESLERYVFCASPTVLPELFRLSYPIGTGGAAPPVFQQVGPDYTLFGRRLVLTSKLSTLGTVGDCIAVDPSQYLIGLRSGVMIDSSKHAAFDRDVITLRATIRIDGQPAWAQARSDEDGVTRSPFVGVATRS
jgi:HK97 family phage major capsid protein